ncbi:DUF4192 domain-containing protein [Streptomyces collinus]|uniref:DUF4192 domain-containing protein n=1 Tax=Streptomyces collinus TaxID=42684 RepID=UPI002941FE8D|nr:DUF4192 family protein [Streptomyces collinus]
MTNHGETTGPFENGDILGRQPLNERSAHDPQVTLRTPAELADALPYLLGYRPEDSIVLVALHDREGRGRFGGRARLGIPAATEDWEAAVRQLAQGLVTGSERRGAKPEQMVAYVCQEPGEGETGRDVMIRLRPLIALLRTQCGTLDAPVIEALCISDGRFWSYCCPTERCCPDDGTPMGLPGTSVLAAAATYAGIQVRGTLRELRARLLPWETGAALEQEIALDAAGMDLVPRILDDATRPGVAEETLDLAERIIRRFTAAPPVPGAHRADIRDDELLAHDEAATLILGLQDRTTRDRAAAWMEGDEAGPALRLWRALARRCVGPYGEHAAAPLTLAGWVAWSNGDELEAREALAMALGADPDYLFARLLHQACNEGLDPESIRRCLRAERAERTAGSGPAPTAGPARSEGSEQTQWEGPERARSEGTEQAGPEGTEQAGPAAESTSCPPSDETGPDSGSPAPVEAGPVGRISGTGGPRRRRRTRTAESGDGASRPPRGDAARRRPTGSHPRTQAGGPTRRGDARPDGSRTRTEGAPARDAAATGGRRDVEGDG